MMITRIYQPNEYEAAAKEIQLGELIAFPTETVYGLGADATNEQAAKRVYLAKGRPSDNPLIVTVSSQAMMERFTGPVDARAQRLIDHFWPGSLTLIFNVAPGKLSKTVTGGLTTAAFRCPANETTRKMIAAADTPIVGPSANTSGKPSPTTAQHVYHDMNGRIAGIIDDGPTKVGVESTILDLSKDQPTVLRPGAVTPEEIESVLGGPVLADNHHVGKTEIPKAPGMKYKHYAPAAQVLIVAADQWPEALRWADQQEKTVGIMASASIGKQTTHPFFDLGADVTTASHRLFAGLRYFDSDEPVDYILAPAYPEEGLGMAYMNRLRKAAGNQFFNA